MRLSFSAMHHQLPYEGSSIIHAVKFLDFLTPFLLLLLNNANVKNDRLANPEPLLPLNCPRNFWMSPNRDFLANDKMHFAFLQSTHKNKLDHPSLELKVKGSVIFFIILSPNIIQIVTLECFET